MQCLPKAIAVTLEEHLSPKKLQAQRCTKNEHSTLPTTLLRLKFYACAFWYPNWPRPHQ